MSNYIYDHWSNRSSSTRLPKPALWLKVVQVWCNISKQWCLCLIRFPSKIIIHYLWSSQNSHPNKWISNQSHRSSGRKMIISRCHLGRNVKNVPVCLKCARGLRNMHTPCILLNWILRRHWNNRMNWWSILAKNLTVQYLRRLGAVSTQLVRRLSKQ